MKLFQFSKKSAGFTLVELLIVIALLGALAAGLLVTINPVEQLAKGRDTTQTNVVREFYGANIRYYSSKGTYAWGTSLGGASAANGLTAAITSLINAGELKSKFVELAGTANLANVFVTQTAADQLAVCFKPSSKGVQVSPNTIYDISGGTSITTCKSGTAGGTSDCYYCVQ